MSARQTNYSVLQLNTLAGLSETAGQLYLKLLDDFQGHGSKANERRAFLAACDYDDRCGTLLDHVFQHSPSRVDSRTKSSLSSFFAERWRHNFMSKAAGNG